MLIIDALQYVNWTRSLFEEAIAGGVNAIHVTISYWENTEATLANIGDWRRRFRDHSDLIMLVRTGADILTAQKTGRVGIILGFQNCSPIEDDLRKVEMLHEQGARIMQLTYNNQSLLATGCYEEGDSGVTRFGREVIKEMNRVGMIIDMSHSSAHSTLQTIELSERPIAITHANPSRWHEALRNKSDDVLKALSGSGGMFGFSMYPFHLNNGPDCTLDDFCGMIMDMADMMGIDHIGIGSDLCQNWGYETLEWMRSGTWTFKPDYGEGSAANADWPRQPDWFSSSLDFGNIAGGLKSKGMTDSDVEKVMGRNWLRFFEDGFEGAV
jgi:microsomal dipeptidase-like Zn-dependent dipeptidase